MGLTFDPRAKPGVANWLRLHAAVMLQYMTGQNKLNFPLHVSMYQFLDL